MELVASLSIPAMSDSLSISDMSDCVSSSESDTDFMELIHNLSQCEEQILFQKKGFEMVKKICNIRQGELIEARCINTSSNCNVQIKKIDKLCNQNHVTFTDEYNMNYVMDDDIIKEQHILNYLATKDQPINNCISKIVSFFDSETHWYLVTELPTNQFMTLKQFTTQALIHVQNGKLTRKEYLKGIRNIYCQLSEVMNWLHNDLNLCHLNLSINNIILKNAEFIEQDQSVHISTGITVQLTDFSKSEIFKDNNFVCRKSNYVHLSDYGAQYFNPKRLKEENFNSKASDMWALGMILYEVCVGKPIYTFKDITEECIKYGPYCAVMSDNLYKYICMNALYKCFNPQTFKIICQLLQVNENKRLNSKDLSLMKWLSANDSETS